MAIELANCGSHISTSSNATAPSDWCVHNMSGSGGERFSTLFRSMGKAEASRKRKKTATSVFPLASSDAILTLESSRLRRCQNSRRVLKKSVQQGRGEPKPEAYPLGYVEDFDEPRTLLAGFFSILLKVSCLDDVLNAINVEPVPGCVQDSDRILPFQQFLEQLGDAGLVVGRLGEDLHNDVGDERGCSR